MDGDPVGLRHLPGGMGHVVGKVPVVCKKQQPFGVHIQPPYGEDPLGDVLHQLCHTLSSPVIGHGRQVSPGLIEHIVDRRFPLAQVQLFTVHLNVIPVGIHLLSHGGDVAVHLDPALCDQLLRLPPGAKPALRQYFLQTNLHANFLPSCRSRYFVLKAPQKALPATAAVLPRHSVFPFLPPPPFPPP